MPNTGSSGHTSIVSCLEQTMVRRPGAVVATCFPRDAGGDSEHFSTGQHSWAGATVSKHAAHCDRGGRRCRGGGGS